MFTIHKVHNKMYSSTKHTQLLLQHCKSYGIGYNDVNMGFRQQPPVICRNGPLSAMLGRCATLIQTVLLCRHLLRRHNTEYFSVTAGTVTGRFAPSSVRPLDVLPPRRFTPWTFRPLDGSPSGRFAPGRFATWTVRPQDVSPPRRFATTQWTIRPLDWRIIFVNNTNDCVAIANIYTIAWK